MASRLVLLSMGLVLVCSAGCSGGGGDETAARPAPPRASATGMPRTFPVSALRVPGPGELVLAQGEHGIELTLAEYNARLDESPLPTDLDTLEARSQTLRRLVYHKVVAAEGRLRGYGVHEASSTLEEERQLARRVMQAGMAEAQNTDDQEARRYFEEHRDEFPDLESDDLEDPNQLLHVKFTLHNHRWRETVEGWLEREEVVIYHDRFDSLQSAARGTSTPPSEEIRP